jgi:organic radical activating enzyme
MKGRIRISEIFGPTIQGEGPLIGRPTVFVRTGGCDYRCRWCDTLYAVLPEFRDEWMLMTPAEILARVEHLAGAVPVLVSLTGGNPALQPLAPLIVLGHQKGYRFALETQGSLAQPWFAALEWLMLSPKPPSSGMATDWRILDDCVSAAASGPQCAQDHRVRRRRLCLCAGGSEPPSGSTGLSASRKSSPPDRSRRLGRRGRRHRRPDAPLPLARRQGRSGPVVRCHSFSIGRAIDS